MKKWGWIILISLALIGCNGSLKTRDPNIFAGGSADPHFTRCQVAIDRAYRQLIYLKKHARNKVTYLNWSKINDLLGGALSAMEFGHFDQCVDRAQQIHLYLQRNIQYTKWKNSSNI